MQESDHTTTPGCKTQTKADIHIQNEAATLAAGHPRVAGFFFWGESLLLENSLCIAGRVFAFFGAPAVLRDQFGAPRGTTFVLWETVFCTTGQCCCIMGNTRCITRRVCCIIQNSICFIDSNFAIRFFASWGTSSVSRKQLLIAANKLCIMEHVFCIAGRMCHG